MKHLPSETKVPRAYRTRTDPLEAIWPAIEGQLVESPGLQAKTILDWLRREHPGKFDSSHLRTLQRRIKLWRGSVGPAKEVYFAQVHHPGDLSASDFSDMSGLDVTIAGQLHSHMVYHFVLTYSNWEAVTHCYSESFESLSEGIQNALQLLGGTPLRHRTDRLSAAVNNQCDRSEFTERYTSLMAHYGVAIERTQPRSPNENGDVESSHRGFKTAVDQSLMLRGSREFESLEDYTQFLQAVVDSRNGTRSKRVNEELAKLRTLPTSRLESVRIERVRVRGGSTIQVGRNTYSVHSRLIGEQVEARIYISHIEIWYAQSRVDRFDRLRGTDKHSVNYRHIIDWLVRKPGAFKNYCYQDSLFPTTNFRIAYDALRERHSERQAAKEYLTILHLAAQESESQVNEILRALIASSSPINSDQVQVLVKLESSRVPGVTEVIIDPINLDSFDELLDDTDSWYSTDRAVEPAVNDSSLQCAASMLGSDETELVHAKESNDEKERNSRELDRTTERIAVAGVPI